MVVLRAENGKQALELLQRTPGRRPGAHGHHDARDGRLRDDAGDPRASTAFRTLPIIALTAKAMKEDRQKCIEAGASDYLAKPVSSEQLLSMLRVWLYRTQDQGDDGDAGAAGGRPGVERDRGRESGRRAGRIRVERLYWAGSEDRSSTRRGEGMESERKVNILLVDDQPNNLLALEAILGGMGLNLVRARSGEEALMRVLDDDFAVILMDVQMPGMDGFETAALIRERDRSQHTPIIFLTAFQSNEGQVFQGYTLGAVDFLSKPIVPTVLRSKVGGLRRAVPEGRAGEAPGGPAASRASGGSTSASWPRRSGAGSWSGSARRRPGRRRPPRPWRQKAEELARTVAERARAEEQLRERAAQQAIVAELGQQALAGLDLPALLDEAVAQAAAEPRGRVRRSSRSSPPTATRSACGPSLGLEAGGRRVLRGGRRDRLAGGLHPARPTSRWSSRTSATETRFAVSPLLREHGVVRSGLCVIIQGRDRPFGTLGRPQTTARGPSPSTTSTSSRPSPTSWPRRSSASGTSRTSPRSATSWRSSSPT